MLQDASHETPPRLQWRICQDLSQEQERGDHPRVPAAAGTSPDKRTTARTEDHHPSLLNHQHPPHHSILSSSLETLIRTMMHFSQTRWREYNISRTRSGARRRWWWSCRRRLTTLTPLRLQRKNLRDTSTWINHRTIITTMIMMVTVDEVW